MSYKNAPTNINLLENTHATLMVSSPMALKFPQ